MKRDYGAIIMQLLSFVNEIENVMVVIYMVDEPTYVFIDESGDFNFTPSGTKFFTLTSLSKTKPFFEYNPLLNLRYVLIEQGISLEYFHASEDSKEVRYQVFDILKNFISGYRIDAVIVDKRKVNPSIRDELHFYPKMLGYLLQYLLRYQKSKKVIIFTDTLPIQKRRRAVEKAIKNSMKEWLKKGIRYMMYHHSSKSNLQLQIADYCNWAIYRRWEKNDHTFYNYIKTVIRSEYDIFAKSDRVYY